MAVNSLFHNYIEISQPIIFEFYKIYLMNNYTNSAESLNTQKPYLQYVNFDKSNSTINRQYNQSPDHMAIYSLNTHSNPIIKHHLPVSTTPTIINRNPYLNTPLQLKKQPPRYNVARTNSNKQSTQNRQSQQFLRNKTQNFKNAAKNQTFTSKNDNMNITSSINKSLNSQSSGYQMNLNDHYSQTVDLGSISRKGSMNQSVTLNEEQQEMKQKIKYLQILQYSIRQFQNNQSLNVLKSFKENNRVFLVTCLEKINRLKDQHNRRNSNDLYSESDNTSQQNFFIDDNASDSRTNSLKIQSEIPKSFQRFSNSRQKSNQKINFELNNQVKIRQKLQKQLEQLKKRKSQESQLQKLRQKIRKVEQQSTKILSKNEEIKEKLKNLAFYDSWKVMCDEAQGAKKTSKRLKQELSKRKDVLRTIKQKKIEQNESLNNEINMKDSKQMSKSIDNKHMVKVKPQKYVIGQMAKKQISTNRGSYEHATLKTGDLPPPGRAKSTNRFSN